MFSAFNRIRKNILFCFTNFNIDWQGTDVTPLITLIDDQIANLPRMNFTCRGNPGNSVRRIIPDI